MSNTSTSLATMKLNILIPPYIELSFAYDLNFLWLIVCPKGCVASTYRTQALVEWLFWKGKTGNDCFTVAG
jgi:hypothetical protein